MQRQLAIAVTGRIMVSDIPIFEPPFSVVCFTLDVIIYYQCQYKLLSREVQDL
ncbi:MAG: hypothetical protein F6K47_03685 [Symploca sp. SIO2E6]|nr:hypothetical protein [Symploca sp. SIO2E6]